MRKHKYSFVWLVIVTTVRARIARRNEITTKPCAGHG
nr:MAG TPA: hypothetical protein [Caudoviricetes sp.]